MLTKSNMRATTLLKLKHVQRRMLAKHTMYIFRKFHKKIIYSYWDIDDVIRYTASDIFDKRLTMNSWFYNSTLKTVIIWKMFLNNNKNRYWMKMFKKTFQMIVAFIAVASLYQVKLVLFDNFRFHNFILFR